MKFVHLSVRDTFQTPPIYTSENAEVVEEALLLGAFVQSHVQQQRSSEDLKTLAANKEAELIALRERKDAELRGLTTTLQTLRVQQADLESALRKAQQEVAEREATGRKQERERTMLEMEGKVAAAIQAAEAAEERRRIATTERQAEVVAAEVRARDAFQHALAIREEQIQQGQTALRALESAYAAQAEELRGLNDFLRRKITNVKVKGSDFESEFRDLLIRAFGTGRRFALIDTAKNGVGHAGDFLMQLEDNHVLWEVKNYDKPVPKQEVDKFHRDVLENKEVRVGVMVSRYTDIVGKTKGGFRDMEFLEGKMLIYVNRFEMQGDDVSALQSLGPLFWLWWQWGAKEMDEEDEAAEARVQLQTTLRELDALLVDLTRKRQEWRVHRSRMEETMRWMSEMVEDAEGRVDRLLHALRAGHVEEVLDVPEGLFRPTHMDERLRETIALVLEVCTPSANSEIRLSDLAEHISLKKKISRDTAKKYVLAALQDSAVVSVPGKATLIKGLTSKSA